jgi:hypothetical protein
MRRIILDFTSLEANEIANLLGSLAIDSQRSGIRPLLAAQTPIYSDTWFGNQGQGARIDQVLSIAEIAKSNWSKRAPSIRILLSAFWSLIYEEGSGKSELVQANAGKSSPKAYFQIAADSNALCLRLYYYTLPHLSPKDALQQFWPNSNTPSRASQLLLRYADFVRIHSISETADVEIVVGLLPSAPAEKSIDNFRTLWIEPLAAKLLNSPPYEAPDPKSSGIRPLPPVASVASSIPITSTEAQDGTSKSQRALASATAQILDLRKKLTEREDKIQELRSGGVGIANPTAPPDAENLLEAFQQKYFEAKFQIREFEIQIENLRKNGGTPEEIRELKLKMEALMNREKAWIKKLMGTLEEFRKSAKRTK